ncbi:transglutaminase family protein [Pleomorphomonas carboxyditropha]|uniref:Transglutaminase n=1 Tax=Pleomorphomonas carboxyditropha TaxID=2023338 RepID=A0A2G9WYV4_9HYPH|nr:transglutaminase family protein [Pleomorphomonas carboxyditropha]PIO99290.1 transglutaminase [Pleomorphomonas carboxyditropha]
MIYELSQETRYVYTAEVPYSSHVARLLPVDRRGQTVRQAMLFIAPVPAERRETTDFFGNRLCHFALDRPHDELLVRLEAEVEVAPAEPYLAALTPPAEEVRALAAASGDPGADSPVHGLFPSPSVPLDTAVSRYAALSFPARRPVLDGAIDLMKRIKADFAYVPGATDADTSPSDAFIARKGVCQDFAHVMIAGLRGLALPARYVSGYLRTEPPPGKQRLEGADATHAWVEVWCGDEAGWVGLDPTNGIAAGEDHLILAIGRDYSDVSPLDGVIVASGAHSLTVAVDVIPLSGPPGKRLLRAVE